jgi:hypothetical protein
MTTTPVEQWLRRFLLTLTGWLCVGTVVELLLAKHTGDAVQLVPFGLCGLGLVAVVTALRVPKRSTLLTLRGVMALLLLGSLLGIYEHLTSNATFALDLRPGAVWSDVWLQSLMGAAPLLAPGILALAGLLALAATYKHPALG